MAKEKQPTTKPAWERLETRPTGDETPDALYSAVGRAVSAWNRVELSLAYLFGVFINAHGGLEVAGRAFGAVTTTSGKLDMLLAAADVFIGREEEGLIRKRDNIPDATEVIVDPNDKIFNTAIPNFKTDLHRNIKTVWRGFSERRNDIAHGAVLRHGPSKDIPGPGGRWYLVPSYIDGKKWGRRGNPSFCYTAEDVEFYARHFEALHDPISGFTVSVVKYREPKAP